MAEQQEQNRSEEATPYKLQKAREKGQVARGMDLGFVGGLIALAAVAFFAGPGFAASLAQIMRQTLSAGIGRTHEPGELIATVSAAWWPAFEPLLVLGLALMVLLVFLELVQLRGFNFTTAPLKPDFNRLNPMQGLKRIFSMRMLKETLKNVIKVAVYSALAWLMIKSALDIFADSLGNAAMLAQAMTSASARLLLAFIGAAFFFMVVDQIIIRSEFRKQMRMSRREVTREAKEREGEPRFKQKRRQIHEEMRKQADGLGRVPGSDFVVTNPQHFAVALGYVAGEMDAPVVRAKGQGHFAQLMKRRARLAGVAVIADPALARALWRDCEAGSAISSRHFHRVARHYARLRRETAASPDQSAQPTPNGSDS